MDFNGCSASRLLELFAEIAKIPRPSGHEEKITDFIAAFCDARGISYTRDEKNNLFATLPATAGREKEDAVLFQGHTDMVCEADAGRTWDVENEGVTLRREGDWLSADGTTLGGDDGFAVAAMLALLDGAAESHPRIECLFTTDEEVGLGGAQSFDFSQVTATRLVNLDSEEEDNVLVACAGGAHIDILSRFEWMDFDGVAVRVSVENLLGGHSGADIHRGRTNACRALAAALKGICDRTRVNLASFAGGAKDNAIPRSASAVVGVTDLAALTAAVDAANASFLASLTDEDRANGAVLKAERCAAPEKMLGRADSRQLCDFVSVLPYGALEQNPALGIVETSCNVGIVDTDAEGLHVALLARSLDDDKLEHLDDIITLLCVSYGAEKDTVSRYPGWTYDADSALARAYGDAFEKTTGKRPTVCGVHAGLECGIFKRARRAMDMISIGPDIRDIHTPRERMSVSSCCRVWDALCALLK